MSQLSVTVQFEGWYHYKVDGNHDKYIHPDGILKYWIPPGCSGWMHTDAGLSGLDACWMSSVDGG